MDYVQSSNIWIALANAIHLILQKLEETSAQPQDSTPFVLAPTPAQLGKAPLQRRQSQGNCIPPSVFAVETDDPTSLSIDEKPAEDKMDFDDDESQGLVIKTEDEDEGKSTDDDAENEQQVDKKPDEPVSAVRPEPTIVVTADSPEGKAVEVEVDEKEVHDGLVGQKSFFKKNIEDGMDK